MIPKFRDAFNDHFSIEKYAVFLNDIENLAGIKIPFRIAETPVFIPHQLRMKLLTACDEIISVVCSDDYKKKSEASVPKEFYVPGDEGNPLWLAFDFAVCEGKDGGMEPRLIELQGFPSLFYYQNFLAEMYRRNYDIDKSLSHLFVEPVDFFSLMEKNLLNGHKPENVILLEIEPEKQNTRIDFELTYRKTGIRPVCITDVKREGRQLYYICDGRKIQINRIYNRVIVDELIRRRDITPGFSLTDDAEVEWAGHPNWFFRISKFALPFLKSSYVPESDFVNQLGSIPMDLENYVLKPLYSFAGSGVEYHVEKHHLEKLTETDKWILQRKVKYAPVIKTPEGGVKAEIRMLYCWPSGSAKPVALINLVRLSRGEMIGVKYNKDKSWTGSSVAFMEK